MAKIISVSPVSEDHQSNDIKINSTSKNSSKGFIIWRSLRKNVFVVSICSFTLVIILLIATIIYILNRQEFPDNFSEENNHLKGDLSSTITLSPTNPKVNFTLPSKLQLVSRLQWLAQPPIEPANPLQNPVPYVIIHHTATDNCSSQAECVFHVRSIQTFHMETRKWWDIAYNFLVGGDGEAYEGRGWKSEGAHTYGYNAKSIGIAFIGTFNSFKPPEKQITACKLLIAKGLELGYIRKDYKLLAARQLQTTQSPGAVLYEEIETWDHWSTAS